MPPLSYSEHYENAALRLKNGTPRAWQLLPWVTNRAAARWAKEGSTVVSTVKGTGVAKPLVSGRRFAAEVWVMPEDGPSQVSNRAAARQRDRLPRDAAPPGSDLCGKAAIESIRDAVLRLKLGHARR